MSIKDTIEDMTVKIVEAGLALSEKNKEIEMLRKENEWLKELLASPPTSKEPKESSSHPPVWQAPHRSGIFMTDETGKGIERPLVQIKWKPKSHITALELADSIPWIVRAQTSFVLLSDWEKVQANPWARHFETDYNDY